jgi:hypothetical protein
MNINHIYEDETEKKFYYDNFTGTYFLHDEEWAEPMEFTEDELVQEGIYLNEYCIQQ